MAVVIVKSNSITNRDAVPEVFNNPSKSKAALKEVIGAIVTGAADDIASVYKFCTVPSNARVSAVIVTSDDIGTTATMDVGLYQTTANGGAVVDADFFTAAVNIHGGAISNTDVTRGNQQTIAKSDQMLWEILGLSADPCIDYDVCGTLAAATDASGNVMVTVKFVQ